MKRVSKGFTLIELMIVIAIIAILLALALPAYQDYAIRAKTGEGLSIGASPKLAIAETCQSDPGADITDSNVSGYTFVAGADDDDYVSNVSVGGDCTNAEITIEISNKVGTDSSFNLFLTGDPSADGQFQWNCTSDGEPQHVPVTCRGT